MKWKVITFLYYIIPITFLLLTPLFINIMFQTPDDYIYTQILSGAYTGQPDYHIVFVGHAFAYPISLLYRLTTEIEWYALVLHVLSVLCFSILIWKIKSLRLLKWQKAVLAFCAFLIQFGFIISPQNTIVASELSIVSALLLQSKEKKSILLGLVFFFIGASIRLNAALMVYAILFPIFLQKQYIIGKELPNTTGKFILLLLISVLTYYVNSIPYQSKDWKEYMEYNAARGYIHDNPSKDMASFICSNENERDEWALLMYYWSPDGTILSKHKLNQAVCFLKERPFIEKTSKNLIAYIKANMLLGTFIIFAIGFILIIIKIKQKDYYTAINLIVILSAFVVVNSYMMSFSEVKFRVLFGCVLALCYAISIIGKKEITKHMLLTSFVFSLITILISYRSYVFYRQAQNARKNATEIESFIRNTTCAKIHNNYIGWFMQPQAFQTNKSAIARNTFYTSYYTGSPLVMPIYKSLVSFTENIVLLVRKDDMDRVEIIQRLLKNYYHINTQQKILKGNEEYYLMRLNKQ